MDAVASYGILGNAFTCEDIKSANWATAMPYFVPFVVLIGVWILAFLGLSGVLRYRIDQLGFHVKFVNGRKAIWFKWFSYAAASYLFIVALVGIKRYPDVARPVLTMMAMIVIPLFDLYSPLEETVVFKNGDENDKFDVLQTPIRSRLLAVTDSSKITAMFQGGILSALKGDFSHLQTLTELDDNGIKEILNHVHPIPKQEEKSMDCFC